MFNLLVYTKKASLKVEYTLAPLGKNVAPALTSITQWEKP